jgi:hypothetical protein
LPFAEHGLGGILVERAGAAIGGSVAAFAIIALAVRPASSIRGLINEASGRFRQYFRGISLLMACTFSRAGLKMLA